jgi:N-acetylmuramoyl-L-alanine amidase
MKALIQKLLAYFFKREPKPEPIKKVAICVGHSRLNDAGAKSVGGVSEWEYNNAVAIFLNEKLKEFRTYRKAMAWVRERTWVFDAVVELHFNSFSNSAAKGFEYLYCAGSENGERLAQSFIDQHSATIPGQVDRGAKPISTGERGNLFLIKTKPPAVICEPFFGSNPTEWVLFDGNQEQLSELYADALQNYFAA